MKLSNEIIEEVISYKKRQPYIVFIFFTMLIIPFIFALINFTNLKTCQDNPSNGCPVLRTVIPSQKDSYLSQ